MELNSILKRLWYLKCYCISKVSVSKKYIYIYFETLKGNRFFYWVVCILSEIKNWMMKSSFEKMFFINNLKFFTNDLNYFVENFISYNIKFIYWQSWYSNQFDPLISQSIRALTEFNDGAVMTWEGRLFQRGATLFKKKFCLMVTNLEK